MKYVILFIMVFIIVFVLYLITVIGNKRKLSKFPKSNQALLLINRFKLKIVINIRTRLPAVPPYFITTVIHSNFNAFLRIISAK